MLLSKSLHHHHYGKYVWRLAVFISAFMVFLFLQTPSAFAAPHHDGEAVSDDPSIIAMDSLCVNGLVINHQEQPQSGWAVTAVYTGTDAKVEPQTTVSDADGKFHFSLPRTGRWLFSLAVPSDWEAVIDSSFSVDIAYGATSCQSIRFKVRQKITVTVYKIDDKHTPLAGWTIIATPGPGNTFSQVQTAVTDAQGIATFILTPGLWIFSEQAPAGVVWWSPISPPSGVQSLDVVAPGPYEIRFKNKVKPKIDGCIEVLKQDVPPADASGKAAQPFGLPGWLIRVLRMNDSIAAAGTTNALGKITFNLPLGPYIVQEDTQDGWVADGPTQYQVTLTDANCKKIIFKNKQTEDGFCIVGVKLDVGLAEPYGIPGWIIDAIPTRKGDIDPAPVTTDGLGKFRITFPLDDYRVPGSTYQISEQTRPDWISVGPTVQTVTLPRHPGRCVVVPPFTNRQANNSYPPPQSSGPRGDGHGHQNQGSWQPPHDPNPGSCSAYHTVRRGESVYSIASQYGMSGGALMRANPWVHGQRNNWLYVGQQVCIP